MDLTVEQYYERYAPLPERGQEPKFVKSVALIVMCEVDMACPVKVNGREAFGVPRWLLAACEPVLDESRPIAYLVRVAAVARRAATDPVMSELLFTRGWDPRLLEIA